MNMKNNWPAMKGKPNFHSLWNFYYAQCTLWHAVSGWIQLSSLSQFSLSNWSSKFSTLLNSRHRVQKALDLTIPGKNRDKMSGKKWHFQIQKMIVFFRKLTQTWQLTSTTHSLPQCALCSINISQEVLIILSFHHPTPFFPYLLVKNIIFWGCTEPGSNLENLSLFFTGFWWNGNVQIATVCNWPKLMLTKLFWFVIWKEKMQLAKVLIQIPGVTAKVLDVNLYYFLSI